MKSIVEGTELFHFLDIITQLTQYPYKKMLIVFHQQMSPHKLEIIFQAKEVEEENGYNEYEDDFEVRRQFLTFPFESMDIIYLLCISYLCVNQCIYLKKASIYYKINKTYNFCILIIIILTDAVKV